MEPKQHESMFLLQYITTASVVNEYNGENDDFYHIILPPLYTILAGKVFLVL